MGRFPEPFAGDDPVNAVSHAKATPQLWIGLLLLAVGWPLNWLLPDETRRTAYLFFPLWLGYILVVDALVVFRTGSSLLTRSRRGFIGLFFVSAPAWWLFEVINWRTRNWEYLGTEDFTRFEYFVLCTVSFSTVMPAVFETAELVRTCGWVTRRTRGPRIVPSRNLAAALFIVGIVMLTLTLAWPRYFYPLVWGSVFLLLEPWNMLLRRGSLFDWLGQGDWRPVISLALGALVCGFFWELWNFYGYPRWVYHTPGVEFWYVFEMPLLGYLGYIPFAWELFSLKQLVAPEIAPLRI